uniref:hypothetical protein n=1 Tax=Sphingopyxis sp. LK2115 TaxID=2744558 RepID=UPI001CB7314F
MKNDHRRKSYIVDIDSLPASFPTHKHSDEFWEALGRAVATFGFLEETLGKAIFAFTATREYAADEIDEAYAKWVPTLQRTLSDALGSLISTYGTVVRQHGKDTIENLDSLVSVRARGVISGVGDGV